MCKCGTWISLSLCLYSHTHAIPSSIKRNHVRTDRTRRWTPMFTHISLFISRRAWIGFVTKERSWGQWRHYAVVVPNCFQKSIGKLRLFAYLSSRGDSDQCLYQVLHWDPLIFQFHYRIFSAFNSFFCEHAWYAQAAGAFKRICGPVGIEPNPKFKAF